MSFFDRHQELNIKRSVDATSLNVLRPTARDELGEMFVGSWTLGMQIRQETCGNMQKSVGELKQ